MRRAHFLNIQYLRKNWEKNAENLPVTLGESVDLGVPAPPGDPSGRGDRLDSGEAGLCSLTLEPKDSKLG